MAVFLNSLRKSLAVRTIGIASVALALQLCAAVATEPDGSPQSRMFSKPQMAGANPFKVSELADVELPVALSGFSAVTLRDNQRWVTGVPRYQVVFDGQIYWFATGRELDIFVASPLEYAPVLGGDCIVTFAENGRRVQGQLQYGVVYGRRIYLLHNEDQLNQFRANPRQFEDADLALGGNCIVSRVEDQRERQGMPETTAMVNGLRYQFQGDFQRRQFAANMQRYGVRRQLLVPMQGLPSLALAAGSAENPEGTKSKKRSTKSNAGSPRSSIVMDGFCPVTIKQKSVWERGSVQYQVKFQGKTYLMEGEEEKLEFESNPEKYVPVLSGDCPVTWIDDGIRTPGSSRYAAYNDKTGELYLFAGQGQLEKFQADRKKYEESPALEAPIEEEVEEESVETNTPDDQADQ